MNLTDFRDNALLKLQVGGPFTGGMVDITDQEYILIQVEQTEQPGQRRRRGQQVGVSVGAPGKKEGKEEVEKKREVILWLW